MEGVRRARSLLINSTTLQTRSRFIRTPVQLHPTQILRYRSGSKGFNSKPQTGALSNN